MPPIAGAVATQVLKTVNGYGYERALNLFTLIFLTR
jgi:hypothetical protein